MKKSFFLILATAAVTAVCAGTNFSHDVKTEKKPWTHEKFLNNDAGDFRFIVIPDRTGGERAPGIWASAIDKANLFHPDFIISVGDMVEGIYKPKDLTIENLRSQYDELVKITAKSEAPFFHLVGNHDISRDREGFPNVNELSTQAWVEKFGKQSYYSFVYKNVLFICFNQMEGRDQRPKQCGITETQCQWALNVLKNNPDVRWTCIFVHSPWVWNENTFIKIEKALENRPYTVFSGDFHRYTKVRRHNRDYYMLGTAGGVSPLGGGRELRGPEYGEFDHLMLVTMTGKGPKIVNITLDGILKEDVATTATLKCKPQAKFDIPAIEWKPPVEKSASAANLLKNGSFDDPAMKEWVSRKRAKKIIHEVKNGKLLLSGDVNNKYRKNLTITQNVPVKLEQGKRYRLSVESLARIPSLEGKSATINIRAIDENGKSIRYYGFKIDLAQTGVRKKVYFYTPHPKAVDHQIYIDWMNFEDNDILELDNLELIPEK